MSKILRMKVSIKVYMDDSDRAQTCTRIIDVRGERSLEDLAAAILKAYGFDMDHAFGFYSNVKDLYSSEEVYTLFADHSDADAPDAQEDKGVRNTKINAAFTKNKTMLFLFDYGDEWRFKVQCIDALEPEKGKRYPIVVEKKGKAPEQYPDYEEEDCA